MSNTDTTPGRRGLRSRRTVLGIIASIGGVALAGCTGGTSGGDGMTTTEDGTTTTTEGGMQTTEDGSMDENPDVAILNYALTLEHLENAFYRDGLAEFSTDELMQADALSKFSETVRMQVPEYLKAAGEHEAAHVSALGDTIEQLGGTPVEEADYDFGYETPSEFLAVGKALENTGVAAYAGAAPSIVNNDVLTAALGIHSVEARHASFLNLVNSSSPFPKAVDEAQTMEEVLEIASQFVTENPNDSAALERHDSMATPQRKEDDGTSDVDILNYALTLEHLEAVFYREGLETFSADELRNADVLSDYDEHLRMTVPDRLAAIGDHEAAHVTAIADTVEQLGGTPVEEATYDFGYETASEFLAVGKALENTGVAAYAGAATSVSNDDVFAAAAGIHSVEARHASFLNELNVSNPFPMAVDEPMTMDEVVEIAGQFIVEE
ncbi:MULTISPECIES: ferritin-like domain-containing protein [unclassified Haladaptatus]|uniref:ferritin-like domain-containing protein n=1 Tax=unclassified Haladaptatus TaxID=2622732 RepID=UPI0023E76727|nr:MULTISPECIES: ferritin-like domain-containing protein [unclassified Haladaptatus]